jgi:hypothetical protein
MARDMDLSRASISTDAGLDLEEMEGRLTEPYEEVLTSLVGNIEHIDLAL